MGYKTVLFSNPCSLFVKNRNLVYTQPDSLEKISVPLEDISTIVIDSQQINLTSYFISCCAEYNICVFTCNKSHIPNGIFTPFYQHSRNTKIVLNQINVKESFKNRAWQKIIKQKIKNQSDVIRILYDRDELDFYIGKVQSGDKTNIEGQTSKIYWNVLFDNFKRHRNDKINTLLNWGYAIIRGTISKNIASSGLIPCLGVKHCNELNAFNLTEDLIEPFRPFVDLTVARMQITDDESLTKDDKAQLLYILHKQCNFKNEQVPIQTACEKVCKSFVRSIEKSNHNLLELPCLIGGK